MKNTVCRLCVVAGLATVLSCADVQAGNISGLYTTGVDTTGTLVAPGAADPHYKILQNSGN